MGFKLERLHIWSGEIADDSISFGWSTASNYALDVVSSFPSSDPHCPGTLSSPTAQSGYVCIYQRALNNTTGFSFNGELVYRFGLEYYITSAAAGYYETDGSWAVTGN